MAFLITAVGEFAAAHQLRLYDGRLEPLHGHDWRVKVTVRAEHLDSIGLVMDFHILDRLLEEVLAPCRNRHLNELPEFANLNPSAENVALHVARSLRLPPQVALDSVEVWETTTSSAIYRP